MSVWQSFQWENDVSSVVYAQRWFIAILSIAYVSAGLTVQTWAPKRKFMNFPVMVPLWNFALAGFNVLAATRLWALISEFWNEKENPICDTSIFGDRDAYWVYLFASSKVVEMLLTILLVLSGRRISVLHWWRNASTFVVSQWICFELYRHNATAVLFVLGNACICSLLYLYYGIKAIAPRVVVKGRLWLIAGALRLAQMFLGVTTLMMGLECYKSFDLVSILGGGAVYSSHITMFLVDIINTYCEPQATDSSEGNSPSSSTTATADGAAAAASARPLARSARTRISQTKHGRSLASSVEDEDSALLVHRLDALESAAGPIPSSADDGGNRQRRRSRTRRGGRGGGGGAGDE